MMIFYKKRKTRQSVVIRSPHNRKRKKVSFVRNFIFTKYFVATLVFLVVAGGVVYYFFFSGEFEITSVNISGVNEQLTQEVENFYKNIAGESKFIFLDKNNTLLFPQSLLEKGIVSAIPEIKNVKASIAYPNVLNIGAQERKQKGIWCNYVEGEPSPPVGSEIYPCYFYDFNGFIYEESPSVAKGSLIVAIRDTRVLDISLPQQVLDPEIIGYLDKLIDALEIAYRKPVYITISKGEDIKIGFLNWEAYFSRSNPIIESVENLVLVLDEKVDPRSSELEYIDLRLGSKIFYKWQGGAE